MATVKWTDGGDNWSVASDWDDGIVPTSADDVLIQTGTPQITAGTGPVDIHSLTVDSGASVSFSDAAATIGDDLTNAGGIYIDNNGGLVGPGGSLITIVGTVTNTSQFNVGTTNLATSTTVNVGAFNNFLNTTNGTINLSGDTANAALATLSIQSAAGLGGLGDIVGSVNLTGDALLEFASGQITTIFSGGELTLDGPNASIQDVGEPTSNSALTSLATLDGNVSLYDITPLTLDDAVTNNATLGVDNNGGLSSPGGAQLTLKSTLSNDGTLSIGTNNLSADTIVTVAGLDDFVDTTLGTINLNGTQGGSGAQHRATLDILGAVGFGSSAGVLIGNVNLVGDTLLEFASGSVSKIAAGSELTIYGPNASVASGSSSGTNSALKGLTTVAGVLNLYDIAPLTLTGGLTNTGYLYVDNNGGLSGPGGTSLTITGALTNSATFNLGTNNLSTATTVTAGSLKNFVTTTLGTINISGNTATSVPTPVSATLDVSGLAGFGTAGVLTGSVNLTGGKSGFAAIEFASGQINTIAANSELTLYGQGAFIEDSTSLGSNSALTGLTTITGTLSLDGIAPLTLSGALKNTGTLNVDSNGGLAGPGSTRLTITNALTNSGTFNFGTTNLSKGATVTAGGLTNFVGATLGTIAIDGYTGVNVPAPTSAILNINNVAGFGIDGVLSGQVNLDGGDDGYAEIQFASGEIDTIAAGSELTLQGLGALVDDATGSGANSALTGLTTIAGSLNLYGASPFAVSAGLTVSGNLILDNNGGLGGPGGSEIDVADTLTDSGTITLGQTNLGAQTTLTADDLVNTGTINLTGSLNFAAALTIAGDASNDAGSINLYDYSAFTVGGGYTQTAPATLLLQITSPQVFASLAVSGGADIAGGTLDAQAYYVTFAAGQSYNLLTFASGQLQGIYDQLTVNNTTGASTDVNIGGGLIEGLVYDDAAGNIQLQIAAAPASTADLWTAGSANWSQASDWSQGGPRFYSDITIGAGAAVVTLSSDATIDSLTLDANNELLTSTGTDFSIGTTLTTAAGSSLTIGGEAFVAGASNNSGAVDVSGSVLDIRGAATGSGGFGIGAGAKLEFGAAVSETISYQGAAGTVKFDAPAKFTGTLDDILVGDVIDLAGITVASATVTGDTLSFSDSTGAAYSYALSNIASGLGFTTASDGADGTLLVAACFARGTHIRTLRGEVAIEDLHVGDYAVAASGALRPINWIGRRGLDVSRHPNPAAIWPVRIAAHAFAPGAPHRDLWLSPGHNVAFGGRLMPISCLINGRSVAQVEIDRIEYWHVELDAHDILLAEGLASESYLDTGNRTAFANGGAFVEAHPNFQPRHWAQTCLPLVLEGPYVAAARAHLLARLAERGCEVDQEGDAFVSVDGLKIEPLRLSPTRLAFTLPSEGQEIVLRSRTFIPAHTVAQGGDPRSLGLCVGALQIDGATVALDRDADAPGWHETEFAGGQFSHRWTTGATTLPAGARIVIVDLAGAGYYWANSRDRAAPRGETATPLWAASA